MFSTAGRREDLTPRLVQDIERYRHKVFVEHLGWPLQAAGGAESDAFDGPRAVYVAAQDDEGRVNGVARLLPTTSPYLLERVFPTLWAGTLPRDPGVWELSRFAAMDFHAAASLQHQASAAHAAELLREVVRVAAARGASTLVTVSPVGMERLLRVNGFHAVRAGVPAVHEGAAIVALRIDC